MRLRKLLQPDYCFQDVGAIDDSIFASHDVVIWDIDNTLFYPETTNPNERAIAVYKKVARERLAICVSNSLHMKKRRQGVELVLGGAVFLTRKKKPFRSLYHALDDHYGLRGKKLLVIGDRLFTDVAFGNRMGATTVLLMPFSKKEQAIIRLSRVFERMFMRLWKICVIPEKT